MRVLVAAACLLVMSSAVAFANEAGTTPGADDPAGSPLPVEPQTIAWHKSRALGLPWRGRLARGVQLPAQGEDFFTWDSVLEQSPNRGWRRWGTDKLLRTLLRLLKRYRTDNPGAPRVGIGDISRKRGGRFGKRYGGLGHKSHQNGLDVDVLYPRLDRLEARPERVSTIDRELAQDLVDRFVDADAQYVFVGPRTKLKGPRRVVEALRFHDDHMHVRIYPRRR